MVQDQNEVWQGTFYDFGTYRPQHQATANASYFFNTGSIGHELKFGFGYRHIIGGSTTTWPGNQDINYLNYNGSGQSYVKLFRNLAVNETMTLLRRLSRRHADGQQPDGQRRHSLRRPEGLQRPLERPGQQLGLRPEPGVLAQESRVSRRSTTRAAATEMHFKDWEPRVGIDVRARRPEVHAASRVLRAIRGSARHGATWRIDNPVGYTYMTYPFTDANHNGLADPGELGAVYVLRRNRPEQSEQPRLAEQDRLEPQEHEDRRVHGRRRPPDPSGARRRRDVHAPPPLRLHRHPLHRRHALRLRSRSEPKRLERL